MQTLTVIKDREALADDIVRPREFAEAMFRDLSRVPTHTALQLHLLLFKFAGPRAAEDCWHEVPAQEIRRHLKGHLTRERLEELAAQLVSAVLVIKVGENTGVSSLLRRANIHWSEDGKTQIFRWRFGDDFREMVEKSNYWTMLNRSAILAMTSRYSIILYEIVSARINMKRKFSEEFSVEDLRKRLGVPPKSYRTTGELKAHVLTKALLEVNQLGGCVVSIEDIKTGKKITGFRLHWRKKTPEELAGTNVELDRSKVGRKARRTNSVEKIVPNNSDKQLEFPAGSISYDRYWAPIAKEHGNGVDINKLASRFRDWSAQNGIPLSGAGVEQRFKTFCARSKSN